MEARDYLHIYWKERGLIIAMTLIAAVATWVVVSTRPERIAVTSSFAVNRLAQEPTPDYQYDGYYALQAVELFSQTVVSWFNTAPVLQEMYAEAKLDPDIGSIQQLPSRFSVKRYSPQNIVIRFTESSRERAEKISAAMRTILEQRASKLNAAPNGQPLFEVIGTEPVIVPTRPNTWLFTGVALVLGWLLGLFTAATRHYLRR